ncbi:hypothetical protein BJY24_002894 [Nocardia transvalensis]|uniref:Uncharacterized protein n=1 Tax=Nocardia transvalensis TaxID=37333 RepID=A0A7W9UIB9_9NOCA|nr:hypothetical protein [Nocardia transvalensis]MBB5914027.1 hypothetical protein [Nocardia transvalensis]
MIDLTVDGMVVQEVADIGPSAPSTPLQRAARRLQDVLPPGWHVDVVDAVRGPGQVAEPILRILMPER